MLLSADRSQLLVVDIQERLVPALAEGERVVRHARLLATAARRLGVPITVTEQYPKGLGATVAPVREAVGNAAATFPKTAFSALKDQAVREHLARAGDRRQLVVAGCEAHVCVLQTCLDARAAGYEVFVVADGVGSRVESSETIARERMAVAGISPLTAEMAVFEWLERAGTDDFRALSALIR